MSSVSEFAREMDQFTKDLEALGRTGKVAVSRALNRAATAGRTAMVRAVKAETGLGSRFLSKEVRIEKSTANAPRATVTAQGRRVPLIAFKAKGPEPSRGRGRGVTTSLPGAKGRLPHAFIARMPSGHRGVFQRKGKRRLPIEEQFGPSAPELFEKHFPAFARAAGESFDKNLRSEISFAQSKAQAQQSE